MSKIGVLNILMGVAILAGVIINDIKDTAGFLLFFIGILILISGVLLNKKIRNFLINVVLNFL